MDETHLLHEWACLSLTKEQALVGIVGLSFFFPSQLACHSCNSPVAPRASSLCTRLRRRSMLSSRCSSRAPRTPSSLSTRPKVCFVRLVLSSFQSHPASARCRLRGLGRASLESAAARQLLRPGRQASAAADAPQTCVRPVTSHSPALIGRTFFLLSCMRPNARIRCFA